MSSAIASAVGGNHSSGATGLESPDTDDSYSWPFSAKEPEAVSTSGQRTATRKKGEPIRSTKGAAAASVARKRSRRGVKIQRRPAMQHARVAVVAAEEKEDDDPGATKQDDNAPVIPASSGASGSSAFSSNASKASENARDRAIADGWDKVKSLLRDMPQSVLIDIVQADIEGKRAANTATQNRKK